MAIFFKLIKLIIYFIKVDKNCHKWLVLDLSNSYTITVTIVLLIFAGINFREVGKKTLVDMVILLLMLWRKYEWYKRRKELSARWYDVLSYGRTLRGQPHLLQTLNLNGDSSSNSLCHFFFSFSLSSLYTSSVGMGPFPEQPSVLDCNEFHARNLWIPYSTFI